MKSLIIIFVCLIFIGLLGTALVGADDDDDNSASLDASLTTGNASVNASVDVDDDDEDEDDLDDDSDDDDTMRERAKDRLEDREERLKDRIENEQERLKLMKEFRKKMMEHKGKFRVEGSNITINDVSDEQKEIIAGRINAKTGLNLTADDIGNGTRLRAILSNGRFAEVKIMPHRASAVALAKLRAKCLDRNCTVELKEVGIGNKTRLAYEIRTEQDSRLFFIFKNRMVVRAEVDAETGDIIRLRKPWWSFASNEIEEDAETEAELEAEGNTNVSS